ncbi:KR domain-containing protein, partial [Paenibacillus alba]|uniref:type I polyketide synthase n=1 Tax=Paenibacillus alba TaxID=1197127 RepID=UPI001564F054
KSFREYTKGNQFCVIGSVKSNIGHCESAAGIAGLTKVLLQLKYRQLVPSLHSKALNPNIDFENSPFVVQQELKGWERPIVEIDGRSKEYPRVAGISSFGAGGSNAHILVAEYIPEKAEIQQEPVSDSSPAVIVISAKNEEQLNEKAKQLLDAIEGRGFRETDVFNLAYTLQVGREAMEERAGFIAESLEEVKEKLSKLIEGHDEAEGVYRGQQKRNKETITDLFSDEELQEVMDKWLLQKKYSRILGLWVKGGQVEWSKLYGVQKARRISLPTYPFARERYWITNIVGGGTIPFDKKPDEVERKQINKKTCFVEKGWEKSNITKVKANINGKIIILANQETMKLAEEVSKQLQSTMIVTLEEVINNFPAIEADFNSYGGYIDLLGCGSERIALDQDITFLQKMIENGKRNGLILLGVTKGLEPFGDNNSINLSGASRVALYRMLQSEYSHVTSRHVDLDSTTSDKQLAVFIKNEFLSESKEAEICYRDNMRYTAIMKEVKENKPIKQTFQFPKEHVLWVTGGTKGIGMLLAQHFVAKYGVKHLVLMGREELPPKEEWRSYEEEDSTLAHKIKNIRNLENMGATVKVLTVPLLDEQALKGAIEQVKTEMGPIGGVIHSAGMVNMQNPAFIRKSLESINQVLEPKVKGLEILYSCLSDEPLKFFVLLSSVAAAIPSLGSGQSDYAMANAFMDYFAHLHHSENHIVSIQWPNWKESGMGEIKGTAYRNTGILSLTNNEGLSLLDQILVGHYGPVILPTVVNTDLWDPQMVMKKSLTDNKATKKAAISLFEESNELLTQTKNWLLGLFSNELKIEEYKIQSQISFEEYGVDSVLMAQILQQINNILDENVDPSLLFEYQTIDSLAKYLYQKYNNTLAKRFNFTVNNSIDSTHSLTNQKSPISINHIEERATSSGSLSDSPKGSILQNIAVIGISCQFPGANTLEEYWGLLKSGKSALGKVPFQRWGYESNFYAGLLDNISKFDPQFFKMSEEDVRLMDPQALLLLKECLKLIYHAGYTEKEFGGTNTGVYIGGRSAHQIDEHHLMHAQNPILAVAQNFLATNISKYFDLKGPSLVVDTACSSSLVAMQIASQALVHKEISSAIVGGVSLLTTDAPHKIFESRKILSENPEYHVFDKRAQGVVLGEGIGLVLLKTVEQALKDGDKIFAVIKSIAVNNDGRTVTSTAPNFQAHKEVMVAGIDKSGREVAEISYLETNGSGTQLTDLLELKAIQSVYRESKKGPLFIGSIKPNIGHPLCAEGIASFIKVAMMIHHKQLVPFMSGYEQMDYFDMNNSPLFFNRKLMDWENHHKIAAINCFADGGTNVHVIMENWDDALDSERMVRSSINPPVLDEKDYSRTTEASTINSGMNDTKLKNTNIWDMF